MREKYKMIEKYLSMKTTSHLSFQKRYKLPKH